MVPAAIGTQVGGSIIRPASYCGNYALKPTQGAINRGERQATSMSTHGPHAGCLEDMWAVAIEIATRAGGDPGREALSGPIALPGAHKPAVLAVMETEGWPELDEDARGAFEQIVAQLGSAGVQILRRKDHPELERFERTLVGARPLAAEITAWENHWLTRNLVAQNPDGVSARGRRVIEVAERVGVGGYRERIQKRALVFADHYGASPNRRRRSHAASPGPAPLWPVDIPGPPRSRRGRPATPCSDSPELAARRARRHLAAGGGARLADGHPADGAAGRRCAHHRDRTLAARGGASGRGL